MEYALFIYCCRASEEMAKEEPRKTLILNEDTKVMLPAIKVSRILL